MLTVQDCDKMVECKGDESAGASQGPPKVGTVYVLNHEHSDAATVRTVLGQVKNRLTDVGDNMICLGVHSTTLGCTEPVLTPSEYMLRLLRQYDVHSNEREMLLSPEDQLIAVQLCLAEKNKEITGDFDVEVSRVLEYNQRLEKHKLCPLGLSVPNTPNVTCLNTSLNQSLLNTSVAGCEVDFEEFLELYAGFLKMNNLLDRMDMIGRLEAELVNNEDLKRAITEQNVVILQPPEGAVASSMFRLLSQGKPLEWIKIAEPLVSSSESESNHPCPDHIMFEKATQEEVLGAQACHSGITINRNSITENYIEKIMLGYLHLLVNSRNEIALARVINTPDRELDHKAFTDIKHEAKGKAVSMYQICISYIMKIRLGGKSYAPKSNSRLAPHVTGLGEFTDLMHKLQTIIEEVPDERSAIQRVFNVIKNTILKCKDSNIRRQSVENVKDKLQQEADWVIDSMNQTKQDSPKRNVSSGGSLVGRHALRVLRWILDHASTQPLINSVLDSLTDVVSSQKTPLRFPSVLSKFRSPIECSPEAAENRTLAQRMMDKYPVKKVISISKPQGSFMDWAKPLHDVGLSNDSFAASDQLDDYVQKPSKTIAHPGTAKDVCSQGQSFTIRVLESIHDQENLDNNLQTSEVETASQKSDSSKNILSCTSKPSTKRPLGDCTNAPSKKRKLQPSKSNPAPVKSKPSKSNKKKVVPLQKGQKTLGAFFRI